MFVSAIFASYPCQLLICCCGTTDPSTLEIIVAKFLQVCEAAHSRRNLVYLHTLDTKRPISKCPSWGALSGNLCLYYRPLRSILSISCFYRMVYWLIGHHEKNHDGSTAENWKAGDGCTSQTIDALSRGYTSRKL